MFFFKNSVAKFKEAKACNTSGYFEDYMPPLFGFSRNLNCKWMVVDKYMALIT